MQILLYSGTPLNRHPSTADAHDITNNSESPDCRSTIAAEITNLTLD